MKTKTELKLKKLDNRAHVLIVGLGLIGGSYAKALSKRGFAVNAITAQQADIDYAVKEGFLREGSGWTEASFRRDTASSKAPCRLSEGTPLSEKANRNL